MFFVIFILAVGFFPGESRAGGSDAPCYMGFAVDVYPVTRDRLDGLREIMNRPPDIVMFYLQWPAPGHMDDARFPLESVRRIWDAGSVPCLTWEPMYIEGGHATALPATFITGGECDGYISRFASKAGEWGNPVLIRFGHEMNLNRYHWGTTKAEYGPDSPEIYKRMFRHVVKTARNAGGTNLLWVFCPNAESVPGAGGNGNCEWNKAVNYYPGNSFVDVLGLDGYNWGITRVQEKHGWKSRSQSFDEIFRAPAKMLHEFAPDKPLFVFETASVGTAREKKAWLKNAVFACSRLGISGLVWFQVNKENDWRLPRGLDPCSGVRYEKFGDWIRELNK